MLINATDCGLSYAQYEGYEPLRIWVVQVHGAFHTLPYPSTPLHHPPIHEILEWCNGLPNKVIARFKLDPKSGYQLFEQNIWFTSKEDIVHARMIYEDLRFQVETTIFVRWPE